MASRAKHEARSKCRFTFEALSTLLSRRSACSRGYSPPGDVIRFIDKLAVKYSQSEIGAREVVAEIAASNRVNSHIFDPNVPLNDAELKEGFNKALIGQPEAVQKLTDIVHLIKAGLNNPEKPLGVFLFIGPTGVGKTQAAEEFAGYLFSGDTQFLRFDMNEFIDEGSLERLIGSFSHPEGQLTGKVRLNPFCLLLLDEIEKAQAKVHDNSYKLSKHVAFGRPGLERDTSDPGFGE